MDESLSASIVIATYNRSSVLAETLASLSCCLSDVACIEVIVVNNNSKDDTQSVAIRYEDQLPQYRVLLESSQGLSFARNHGVVAANGEIVVFLDDDVELDKDWLSELLLPFANPDVAVVGGRVLPFGMQVIPDWLPREYSYLASVFDPSDLVCEMDTVMGANFAVRRQALDEVGLFDVKLGRKGNKLLGGEEVELFRRIRNAGYRIVYTPRSIVWHKIAEKLKPAYIEEYAYWLGVSEAVIDKTIVSRVKYLLKLLRSAVFPWLIYPIQKLLSGSDSAACMRFTIKRNYARGYLAHSKAVADMV